MKSFVFLALGAYLLGSVSVSFLLGKFIYHMDIRKAGSGNPGSTNALRTMGKAAAAATLAFDVLKGVAAAWVGQMLAGQTGMLVGTFFVILGHCYSLYLRFQGGKGIATSVGALLVVHWPLALTLLGLFLGIVLVTRYVSLGSLCAAAAAAPTSLLYGLDGQVTGTVLVISLLVIWKHRANLQRLLKGTESRLGEKKTEHSA